MKQDDAKIKYAQIIGLPHHQSATRKHMSLYDRAAQFSSYKALSGYEDMVIEEARLTGSEIELSEIDMELLNQKIRMLEGALSSGKHPYVSLTYFKPDEYKAGGRYETISGFIKRIDTIEKKIILYGSDDIDDRRVSPVEIPIEKTIAISGSMFDDAVIEE